MTVRNATLEAEVSDRFRLAAQTVVSALGRSRPMTFSRIRCEAPDHGKTKTPPPDDAYVVQVMMRDMKDAQLWMYGREVFAQDVPQGGMYLYHLETEPVACYHTPFDTMRMYIAKETLDELASEMTRRRPEGLRRPEFGTFDPMMSHLAGCLAPLLDRATTADQLIVDHIALAVHAHLVTRYLGKPRDLHDHRGGLSTWQERRVKDYVEANLALNPGLAELAGECGLSVSHFARAFRTATGRSPHQWLIERRIEAAKQHLARHDLSLPAIAAACGFADPSHFSRAFLKATGETPSSWRRMRRLIV